MDLSDPYSGPERIMKLDPAQVSRKASKFLVELYDNPILAYTR